MAEATWQPGPCKHGNPPIIEVHPVELMFASGAPTRYMPGRPEVRYDCPTPGDCWVETVRQQEQAHG